MDLIIFKDISFISENQIILNNINFVVNDGDFVSITGPSGSGKSTLLKLCNNLISPSNGQMLYMNKDILSYDPVELRREVSLCFQMPYLFGKTVYDNLVFPFTIRKADVDEKLMLNILKMFNLNEDFLYKDIINLSGGEKQRVSIARSLIFKPQVLLLDEITSALDDENTLMVKELLRKLNSEGITILMITHNLTLWETTGNRHIKIQNGILEEVL